MGSSRTRIRASASRSLSTSTFWRSPTERRQTAAEGSTSKPYRADIDRMRPAIVGRIEHPGEVRQEQRDVLGHAERGDLDEVLEHEADAEPSRVVRRPDGNRPPLEPDLPGVRAVEAVEDLHQGALPRPVLAHERVHLAAVHVEIDPVVGRHAGEPLRDGSEGEEGAWAHGPPILAEGPSRRPPGFLPGRRATDSL